MRIRKKLVLASLFLVTVVLSAAAGFLYVSESYHLRRQMEKKQLESIRRLYTVCQDGVLSGNELVTTRYIKQVSVLPEVLYVMCLDGGGKARCANAPALVANVPGEPLTAIVQSGREMQRTAYDMKGEGPILDYIYRIRDHDKLLGWARIGYRRRVLERNVDDTVRQSLQRFARWSFSAASALGVLVGALLAGWLSRPIGLLREGARRIGGGNLEHRIDLNQNDELGDLALEFNQMAEKLAAIDRMKQEFVNSATHDLRNPLVALRGYTEMLLAEAFGPITERQRKSLDTMLNAATVLNDLVTDMLDLAKLDAGMMTLQRAPLDLERLAGECMSLFEAVAQKERIGLTLESRPIPTVSADVGLIRRVITNLISNALKFTPGGGKIVVRIGADAGGFVSCAVADTGLGIAAADQAKLFSKFHQAASGNPVRKSAGTGLGLAICKSVVEAHGGRVRVESEEGRGTTISFVLPTGEAPTGGATVSSCAPVSGR